MELYLHFPFCKKKCAYCDFTSYAGCDEATVFSYLTALKREIAFAGKRFGAERIDTVYLGGGTPSLMSPREIESLFKRLKESFPLYAPTEVSVEVNPESATEGVLCAFRDAGVNRVSMGVQSFSDDNLRSVGRVHDAATARAAARRIAGIFDNFSLDIIVGLPYDTPELVRAETEEAGELAPHVSVYELTLEEGTPLFGAVDEGRVWLPGDDEVAEYMEIAADVLAGKGLERYEVSNFAKPGYECRHNRGYWTREAYVGLGAGAHSLVKNDAEGKSLPAEIRFASPKDVNAYIAGVNCVSGFDDVPRAEMSVLSEGEIRAESIMLGLRTREGIDENLLAGRSAGRAEEFLERGEGRVRLTERGLAVMNSVLVELI